MIQKISFCILTAFFSCFNLSTLKAQAPVWSSASSASGTKSDVGFGITTDPAGNVYTTGYFLSPTINFGSVVLTNADASGTTADVYIVKYDMSGNVVWAKSAGGIKDDRGQAITSDPMGNIFITGSFQSNTLSFGTNTLTNTSLSNLSDGFVIKFNSSGNDVWAVQTTGSAHELYASIDVDPSGNVYAGGSFNSLSMTLGSYSITNTSTGNYNIFLAKISNNGNVLWTRRPTGNNYHYLNALHVSSDYKVYFTGSFNGPTINFGPITLNNPSTSNPNYYIVKYDSSGTGIWASGATGNGFHIGRAITSDAAGDVIVSGTFGGSLLTFGSTTLTNALSYGGLFVTKYDASGNVLWARNAGGTSSTANESADALLTDINKNIYVAGDFASSTIPFGTYTLTNAGSPGTSDILMLSFDSNGNPLWAKSAGGTNTDQVRDVCMDPSGNCLYSIGDFNSNTISFNSTTLNNTNTYADIFVNKLCFTSIGIQENNSSETMIYPNPSGGKFNIKLNRNSTFDVYTVTGEKIHSVKYDQAELEIDLSDQPSGIYFYELKSVSGDYKKGKLILTK